MSEPRSPAADDVPDHVLDELKLVFAPAAPPEPPAPEPEPVPEPEPPADTAPGPAPGPVAGRPTIVIGGDDGLPDPVYLDDTDLPGHLAAGHLAGRGEPADDTGARSTIIIDNELDSTGAFDAVEVPSRSMDPRVRARRVAVKRARGRKRLLWGGVVVVVVLIGVALLAVFSSSLFAVDAVVVEGATYTKFTEPGRLQEILDDVEGEPVLLVDTREVERRLELIPWIERAFVTTDFPNRVHIDVRERRPLVTFQGSDGQYRVIDRDGRVLSILAGRPTDYMLLIGPAPDTEPGAMAGAPFAAAAQMVSALPGEIRSLAVTASVDATTGDLGLVIVPPAGAAADGLPDSQPASPSATGREPTPEPDPQDRDDLIEVRIGSSVNLEGKLARLLQLIRDGLDGVSRIDVSTDEVSVTKG